MWPHMLRNKKRKSRSRKKPLISIIIPIYNAAKHFEMLRAEKEDERSEGIEQRRENDNG